MPEIDIEKYVNGFEADLPVAVTVWVGDSVTFDYKVTNTGNTPLTNIERDRRHARTDHLPDDESGGR